MNTTTNPVVITGHSHDTPTLVQRAVEWISALRNDLRAYRADRRMRDTLAELSDAQLLDIGIADDEIARIRSFDRFTPRSWADSKGKTRHASY